MMYVALIRDNRKFKRVVFQAKTLAVAYAVAKALGAISCWGLQ